MKIISCLLVVVVGLSVGACAPPAGGGNNGPAGYTMNARGGGVYVVQEGDTGYWSIAEKVYGQGEHWALIAKANPGVDVEKLRAGQKLVIPPLPKSKADNK